MERRFDMTNFEQSLKDHADQFIMVPSKRVWHGIYNNLHPGSRWPSIAVALILVFTLIGIGQLNTPKQIANNNSASEQNQKGIEFKKQIVSHNSTSNETDYSQINSNTGKNQSNITSDDPLVKNVTSDFIEKDIISFNKEHSKNISSQQIASVSDNKQYQTDLNQVKANRVSLTQSIFTKNNKNNQNVINAKSSENNFIALDLFEQRLNTISNNNDSKNHINKTEFGLNNNPGLIKNNELSLILNNIQPNSLLEIFSLDQLLPTEIHLEKNVTSEFIEKDNNKTVNNQHKPTRIHKKRNSKINWVYFVTPAVSTVSFGGKALPPNSNQTLSPIIIQPNQFVKNMLYNARMGYEVGAQMTYAFSKKWQFVTGANLSYSGYNIISNQVHPTFAYLMLREAHTGSPYAKSYITHYGNGQGQNQILLSNTSLQASIPVGMQYVLWGNKSVQFSIASSFEPSIVLKSDAYIISSDGRNYVNDPSLIRGLNLSGNFGSFITFSSNKTKWQVGPSVRYQMFSTYKNSYPVKEHLIDYGIRIGISR